MATSLPADIDGSRVSRARQLGERLRSLAIGVGLYVALRPLFGFGHEVAVAAVAGVLHVAVDSGFWEPIVSYLGLDPVYAGAGIRALGGVDVQGLAVAGPLGPWLHTLIPAVFQPASMALPGAGTSMVAAPGAALLGRGVAAFSADVIWLGIGLGLLREGERRGWTWLSLAGLLVQAHIALNHLLDISPQASNLEATGLPFALALLAPASPEWLSQPIGSLVSAGQGSALGAFLLVAGYLAAFALVRLLGMLRLRSRPPVRSGVRRSSGPLWAGAVVAAMIAVSPVGALAVGESNWRGLDVAAAVSHGHEAAQAKRSALRALRVNGPTPVSIAGQADGTWQYLVDGRAEVIRGVGYNPQYAGRPRGERVRLYDRDFAEMRQVGVNTIEGWFENQFDDVTLDRAALAGIGVLMPFELNQDWDYTSPTVRSQILDRVTAWVRRYASHPAVRMWAPGNENLHRILFPNWVSRESDPVARGRADAFAAFLPVLVDRIHEIDPNHPVIYRDAEDVYLARLRAAFQQTGVERPWLVYGANVYSAPRMQQLVQQWPRQWLGGPLVISEFAPGGVTAAERGLGYQSYWRLLRARPGIVLGGLAYTWATNGPEDLDRIFGLVNADGTPVDTALEGLATAFLSDADP